MAGEQTIEWLKLIERGEDLGQCLLLLREISEREEKAADFSQLISQFHFNSFFY